MYEALTQLGLFHAEKIASSNQSYTAGPISRRENSKFQSVLHSWAYVTQRKQQVPFSLTIENEWFRYECWLQHLHFVKSKVFYGQEPPSGESTTTECGVNIQLFAVMY